MKTPLLLPAGALPVAVAMLAFASPVTGGTGETSAQPAMKMTLVCPAFADGQLIPAKYTADGADVSPPLKWSGVPEGTRSLALLVDDPDAPVGNWTHWVLYELPASATELPERTPKMHVMPNGARQGLNDFKKPGYGGPAPPPGKPHRYIFTLYALDQHLALTPDTTTRKELSAAIQGHVLAQAQITGIYQRKKSP